jgi:hypothetical protein
MVAGRSPAPPRELEYRRVGSAVQFARVLFSQFRLREPARRSMYLSHMEDPSPDKTSSSREITVNYFPKLLLGSYLDSDDKWIGGEASILIEDYFAEEISIDGRHHSQFFVMKYDSPVLNVTAFIEDHLIGVFTLDSAGDFHVRLNLTSQGHTKYALLTLKADRTFCPADLEVNDDNRELSFELLRIRLGTRTIFPRDVDRNQSGANAKPFRGFGVNIVGYVKSEIGIGESSRRLAAALQAVDRPYTVIDFKQGNSSRQQDQSLGHKIGLGERGPISIIHINADQMPVFARIAGGSLFRESYCIGFWHWELPELPDEFLEGFNGLREVWVPSSYVQAAIAAKSPVPVLKYPHAIRFSVSGGANRRQYGIPENRFAFLMMYDFSSCQERKNPWGVLDAFGRAFGQNDNIAVLVIKTQNSQYHEVDRNELSKAIHDRKNVIWIDETMTRQQIYDLESVCDCFVSLHRAEGFGLGLAESMFLAKPVIGTAYSGNMEFMRVDNSFLVNYRLATIERDFGIYKSGQVWAEPDVEHCTELMKNVTRDGELRQQIGEAGRRTILQEFSPEAVGTAIAGRLRFIDRWFVRQAREGIDPSMPVTRE